MKESRESVVKKSFPEPVMKRIRQRYGLDETDTSQDEEFNKESPEWAFAHVCGWELGDPTWSTTIFDWLSACGLEVKEKQ